MVPNAQMFGKKRLRYETNTRVRYYCKEGFVQKLNPVIKCLPGGQWEEPLITCMQSKCINCLTFNLMAQKRNRFEPRCMTQRQTG